MNKKILCFTLIFTLLLALFIPCNGSVPVTMYASDGRTRSVNADEVQKWKDVGWFETAEDAKIITMYSMDGRTLDIPQYYREVYNNVGWYNTKEEVTITMYSMDGRSLQVFKDVAEEFHKVGW